MAGFELEDWYLLGLLSAFFPLVILVGLLNRVACLVQIRGCISTRVLLFAFFFLVASDRITE